MNRPAPTTAARPTPAVHLALLAVQIFFASFSPVGKIVLREVPPVGLAAIRVTLAALVFAAAWLWVTLVTGAERVAWRDLLRLALYAFFGIIANQLLFLAGLSRTSATSAVVLGSSIPVFTVAVAVVMGRERATRWKLAGLGIALGGALLLTGHAALAGSGHTALAGNLLILTNCLSYSIYLVISRDILARIRPLTAMTMVFVFGAIGIDLFLFAGGALGLLDVSVPSLLDAAPHYSANTWRALAYIVVFPTVGAYLLNAVALRAVPASLVATYIYVQPVVGAALAAVLLGERPGLSTLLAATLIFAGVGLVNWDAARQRRQREPITTSASA